MQVDCEKGEGIELAKEYKIKGYPTFVLASSKAETYYRWMGYTKDLLIEKMDKGMADLTTIPEKKKRLKEKPDAVTALALGEYEQSMGEYGNALVFFKQAAKMDQDEDYAYEIFYTHYRGMRDSLFSMDDLLKAADNAISSPNTDEDSRFYTLYIMSNYIDDMPDDPKIIGYLNQANELAQKKLSEGPDRSATNVSISYALHIDKDKEKAVKLKRGSMTDGWQDNASDLNEFSWWCFENKVNLTEAEKLAYKGVKLANAGREKAMLLDTCAEIVFLNGKKAEAVSLIEKAIEEDPGSDYYKKQLVKFKS